MKNSKKLSRDDSWQQLDAKLNIIKTINKNGEFIITSDQINAFNKNGSYGPDARLMTSSDTRGQRPKLFDKENISMLPIGNRAFKLVRFDSFFDIQDICKQIELIGQEKIQRYETIDIQKIASEDKAILISDISEMLKDFTAEKSLKMTNKGKFGVEKIDFNIQLANNQYKKIEVNGGQAELDAGFEGEQFYVIEAKLRQLDDFNIRQLYYPYRYWQMRIKKPVVPLFMVYSDRVFNLWEYSFAENDNFNSLQLIRHKKYTFEKEISTSFSSLLDIKEFVQPTDVPFPQADSFETVINLLDFINAGVSNKEAIAERFVFDERQSDYYSNAAKYLDLLTRTDDGFVLTQKGKEIVNSSRIQRHYLLAKTILSRKVFYDIYVAAINDTVSEKDIINIMKKNKVDLSAETMKRRSSTVKHWIEWVKKVAA